MTSKIETTNELRDDKVLRLVIKYSIPAILAMMVTSLYNTVDRAFIGSMKDVGALAISGLGVTMPFMTILGAFCVGLAVGGSTNIAIKLGEGNKEEAEKALGNTFAIELFVGIAMMIISAFFLEDILYFFGASDDTIKYSMDYMSVIKGAALGTVICQLVICLWSTYYFTKGKSNLKLRLKNIRIESKIIKGILVIALTQFCMELSAGFIHLITNKVLKLYGGDLAIGAMTAITSINLLFYMPVFGISQGMQTIIAYNYGAKQFDRAKKALSIGMIGAIGILSLGLIATRLFPEILIGIFTKDATLMELALNGISIYSLTLPAVGICILGAVYFQSIGNAKMSIVLSLLRQVIVFIPLILLIPKLLGLNGVWAAQPLADIISTLIIVGFLIKEFKVDSVRELSYR